MDDAIKGFQTDEGIKQYDYNALANKPAFITQDEVDAVLESAKDYTDSKILEINDSNGIDISGATPGQTIRIKEVDEAGRPVTWEPVDFSSGSGGIDLKSASAGQFPVIATVDENGVPSAWRAADQTHSVDYEEIMAETKLTGIDPENGISVSKQLNLIVGQEYTVYWNGVAYICTAFVRDDVIFCLGNVGGITGDCPITPEPFAIAELLNDGIGVFATDGSTEATISIYHNVIKKLDNKYLNLDWIPTKVGTEILPEQVVVSGRVDAIDSVYLVNDTPIIVYINGIPHESKIVVDGYECHANVVLQDSVTMNGGISFIFSAQATVIFRNSGTFSIDGMAVKICLLEYNKIPEGYLPDSLPSRNVGDSGINVPNYVRVEAERVAKVVQSRQNANTITFLACSDIHYSSPYNTNPIAIAQNIHDATLHMGQAMGLICSLVHIDFAAIMGDMIRDNEEVNKEEVQAEVRFVNSCLNEGLRGIPSFRLKGNHEEAYSSDVNLSAEEVFANVYAWNTNVTFGNRSIGYFYKDFEDVKLRVVFLNTSEGSGSGINVSAEQNAWLAEVLDLSEKDGNWCSVILSHHPLDFERNGGVDSISTVNTATGLIGTFHGHIHNFLVDYINGTEVKRICIPNAVRDQEDSYGMNNGVNFSEGIKYGKTAGTEEDTAFCVVTIDLKARKIYADHYGAGYSREIDYTYKGV